MTRSIHARSARAGHLLQFYASDGELSSGAGSYLREGLDSGGSVIILATNEHARLFSSVIESAGFDILELMKTGRVVMLDAHELVDSLIVDGTPDPYRFDSVIGGILRDTIRTSRGKVRAFGELVAILWAQGNLSAVIELESLWNGLLAGLDADLYCAYPSSVAEGGGKSEIHEICDHHDHVSGYQPTPNGSSPSARAAFPMSKSSPGAARRFTARTLESWGDSELVEPAAAIVTELMTNAVVHGRSHPVLKLSPSEGKIRISVRDSSEQLPVRGEAGPLSEGGRGLILVDALSSRWGVERAESGKSIWAELERVRPA